MKLKEVDRTANVAWSPAEQHPIYLAAGTAAQQLDATFSTKATVELYSLNLAESGHDMELAGSLEVESRLYKLVWGSFGMDSNTYPSGLLIGGAEQGELSIWDPVKIISGQNEDTLVHKLDKHTGQVIALDINPFQTNLLASGASESEIYIWDLNSPEKPMTPGSKPQTQHAVSCVAWNRQVQHILGSSHGSNCVVWDLRKNEPIIKIRDSMSRIECNMICWHPDVATQLCIASEDDHAPVIQLWDLRCATSPLRLLERHQRGIVSMAWCPHDSDLLLSSGKDNRILCWNPNSEARSGEVLCEVPTSNRWSFDVQWCPRNPGIISGCSFDGHISVYSLMGGTPPTQPPSKVTEAFPVDPFSQPMPQPAATHEPEETMLKKAPKWLRRPVSASFAFGGKLICVENPKPGHGQAVSPVVTISQVVTEIDLVERSKLLETTIASGEYLVFCDSKVNASKDEAEKELWSFLKASFTSDPRNSYLELLNYNQTTIRDKVSNNITSTKPTITSNHASKEVSVKDRGTEDEDEEEEEELVEINNKLTGLDPFARKPDDLDASPFDDIAAKSDVSSVTKLPISVGSDCDGLITEALLTANFAAAVDVALHHNRQAEAMILAIAGGAELLAATQTRVLQSIKSGVSQLLLAIVTRNFENIIRTCDLAKWKEALAIVLTYVDGREFTYLCNLLGSRLESEGNGEYLTDAQLCYVVAGNIDQLVSSWNLSVANGNSPHALQDLVEKVMVLQKAVESSLGQQEVTSTYFARALNEYAHMLAAQGCSLIALHYLGKSNEPLIAILRDRLFHSLGQNAVNMNSPPRPFKVIDVKPERVHQPPQPTQPVQPRSRTTSANYMQQPSAAPFQPVSSQVKPTPVVGPYFPESNPYATGQPFYPHQPLNPMPGYSTQPAPTPAVAPSAATKGPLSKYTAHQTAKTAAQAPSIPTSAGMYDPYQQQQHQQHQQQQQQSHAGYNPAEYKSSHGQMVTNPGSQTPGAPLPAYTPLTSAWNDPPTVTTSKKSSVDHPGAPSYEGILYNPLEYEEQMRQQQQAILEHHQQHQQPQEHHPQPNNSTTVEPMKMTPVQDFRAALPAEHQVIQDVFDKLVELCQARAFNVPTKKKLDDVRRKLDGLYEKLNNGTLSQTTLNGLHQTVRAVQDFDYNMALSVVAEIAKVGSFTEISVFMPGVKVLLQTAVQLQVYIQ